MNSDTTALWNDHDLRVCVCVGSGGVGKTSVAASVALAAACSGRRTLVMTVDPARRLADALGLGDESLHEVTLDVETLRSRGVPATATLTVAMPDTKTALDRLFAELTSNPSQQREILANRIYQHFSTAMAGALELASVEMLRSAVESGRYDLVIVDTPPSQSAREFLSAPNRVRDLIDQDLFRWLLAAMPQGRGRWSLGQLGRSLLTRGLGRFVGGEALNELLSFLWLLRDLYAGLRDRADKVERLLHGPECAFIVVTVAEEAALASATRLVEELRRDRYHVRVVCLNRVPTATLTRAQLEGWADAASHDLHIAAARAISAARAEFDRIDNAAAVLADARRTFGSTMVWAIPEKLGAGGDLANIWKLLGEANLR